MPQSVLIVDDSIPLHALIKTQLKSEPLSFHSAHDGEAGILSASSFRPDLILLDVDMPGLNGFEVCQRLKANPLTSSIPLIFLTAGSTLVDKVKGLESGGSDYIVKPFKPEELKARVRSTLRAARQLEQTHMVDALTGLWNRHYFDIQEKAQLSLAKRTGRPVSCMVIEVDHFIRANAKQGEAAGNEILRSVARILTGKARTEDVVCRFDNSKFAIWIVGTNASSAAQLAERLREDIERQLKSRGNAEASITCSFGVADSLAAGEPSVVERADGAVYRAQQLGRNCVSIARDSTIISVAA
jgi:diguanylate cyclase (GGDEF)-like protein